MLYTKDLKTKLFKDKNNKNYTPASLYLGSKKTGGYSILEPSEKEIEIFNGYNDSAFIKINGESNQTGTPSPTTPSNINSVENFNLISVGKNLFDKDTQERKYCWISYNNLYAYALDSTSYIIPCKPNTKYTVSHNTDNITVFRFCYITAEPPTSPATVLTAYNVQRGSETVKKLSLTTGADCRYLVVQISTTFSSAVLPNLQVELGEENTVYQSYRESIIDLPYTLRSLPDGTKDYIEIDNVNKTAKLYKFVGEFEFTGNESLAQTGSKPTGFRVVAMVKNDAIILSPCLCSHFNQSGSEMDTINELLNFSNSATFKLRLKILSSRLETDDVAGVKAWLTAQYNAGTPVKIIYKLAVPVVTDLDYDEVTTYYPYTKIYTNATVQPILDGKIRVQGENKSALDLTTTDAQISMGNDSALRLRNNFTVACFIKSTIIPTKNQYFLRRYDSSINGRCWGMIRTSTRPSPQNKGLTVLVSSNGTFANYVYGTGNIDTTDGNWHHMAFTYSDKTVKLYVDGILDVTELVSALTSNDLLDTASAFESATSYNGLLDDIRYYSRVLTDDEILKLSKGLKVSDTNMVGHWKCNEGKGTTVKNETNIANTDGTLNAQAKWSNDTIYQ